MIMPRSSDQLLLPVNPLFVWFTLLFALLVNLVPLGREPAMPDLLALVLVFWNVHQSRRVGVGVAFMFGLVMDVHDGAVLGQHALAYTLLGFFAITIHRRLLWFTVPSQAVQILPLFFAAHAGVAARAHDRRRHVPGLADAAGAGVRGAAVADRDMVVAGAAAPRARPGSESAAMTEIKNVEQELGRFRMRLVAAAAFVLVASACSPRASSTCRSSSTKS